MLSPAFWEGETMLLGTGTFVWCEKKILFEIEERVN
jgi:hypothetical protein